jgi:hypothetical protein
MCAQFEWTETHRLYIQDRCLLYGTGFQQEVLTSDAAGGKAEEGSSGECTGKGWSPEGGNGGAIPTLSLSEEQEVVSS